MEAYVNWTDPSVTNGEFRWYASETSTDILYSSPCYNDGATSQYSLYASEGQSVFVCIYNYYTGCETNREQYYFSFPAPPSGYIEYARDCGFGTAEIKAINTSNFGVYFELVKYNNYGNWDYVTSNYTGEFSEQGLDPYGQYAIRLNSGNWCGTSIVLPFSIDYSDPAAPRVYGNVGTCEGRSAEVIATGPQQSIFWYDAAGNFLQETSNYFTPTNLTAGSYTYIARGGNSSGCRSNPASIVVNVYPKPVDGTITASTTTACVGQLVTIANQGGVGTPHYWGSSDGGQTWNLFADGHVGESNFQFTPTAPGTYRFHVRNQTVCGFCWDQPGGCTTFPYVDITVVNPPPVTVSVSSPSFGQGETKLTPSITGSTYQWVYNGSDIPGATDRIHAAGMSGNYSVRVTTSTGCMSVSPPVAVTIANAYNYIITNNICKPGVTTNDQVAALGAADNFQNITYFDAIGRTIQEVVTQGSPGNQDAITIIGFDPINRNTRALLPYTGGTDGSFKPNAWNDQPAFWQNLKGDNHSWAETRFESSPASRPLEQSAPGASWQIGSGHTQLMTYTTNGFNEIRAWDYNPATQTASSTSTYYEKELFITQNISDQGQKSIEYKNKSGQVVCQKVQKTPGDDINYFVTYFVYDDLQNMRFKITPEAVNNLAAVNYTFSYNDDFTKKWLFAYQYNEWV
jgi:hypothetical protein